MKLKEWHRTVLLLVLLAILIAVFIWLRTGFETRSLQNF